MGGEDVKRSAHVTWVIVWQEGAGLRAQATETSLDLRQREETR